MAAKVYHDKDADLNVLKGKTMAVLGVLDLRVMPTH